MDLGVVDAGGGRRAAVEVGLLDGLLDVVVVTVESFDDVDGEPRGDLLNIARELVERECGVWLVANAATQSKTADAGRYHMIASPFGRRPTHLLRWDAPDGTERSELVLLGDDGMAWTRPELVLDRLARWSCAGGEWFFDGSPVRDCGFCSFAALPLPMVSWRSVPISVQGTPVSPDAESRLVLLATWRNDPVGSREALGIDLPPSVLWAGFPIPPSAEMNALGRLARGEVGLPSAESVRARSRLRRALAALLGATRSSAEAAKVAGVSRAQLYVLLTVCGLDAPSSLRPVL
jgi:hypothetical protein